MKADDPEKITEMWRRAGIRRGTPYRAKKYLSKEYVCGNRLTKCNFNNTCYLQEIVQCPNSYRLKKINEWWIDPEHVYWNVPNENGEYDIKINMDW